MPLKRKIGPYETTAIGLGCMPMSLEDAPNREQALATIHAALDAGCRNLDTAWAYYRPNIAQEENEQLIREALETWDGPRDEVLVATKVGHYRYMDADGEPQWGVDGYPEHLVERAKESVKALGVKSIDLLYMHRPDPTVPYEDSLKGMKKILELGLAKKIGLSNVSIEQIDLGIKILGEDLIAVQNQYSPVYRETEDTLEYCKKLGLNFVCWSPLGGYRESDKSKGTAGFEPFKKIAAQRGVSYQQVILAWELSKGEHMITIPGARRAETILDSLAAGELVLTDEELAELG